MIIKDVTVVNFGMFTDTDLSYLNGYSLDNFMPRLMHILKYSYAKNIVCMTHNMVQSEYINRQISNHFEGQIESRCRTSINLSNGVYIKFYCQENSLFYLRGLNIDYCFVISSKYIGKYNEIKNEVFSKQFIIIGD